MSGGFSPPPSRKMPLNQGEGSHEGGMPPLWGIPQSAAGGVPPPSQSWPACTTARGESPFQSRMGYFS